MMRKLLALVVLLLVVVSPTAVNHTLSDFSNFVTSGSRATLVEIKGPNLFNNTFKMLMEKFNKNDPAEFLVLVLWNGDVWIYSSFEEIRINIYARQLHRILLGKGIKGGVGAIAICIHNHPLDGVFYADNRFSDGDIGFWHDIRFLGFKGSYLLYVMRTKEIKQY